MNSTSEPKTPVTYRLLLEGGAQLPVFVDDDSDELVGPCFRAKAPGWHGDVVADTARGAAVKVAAASERRPAGEGVGLPVVAVLAPGEGRPALGPDVAARLAASPFIREDPLLHALRAHLVNGADVAEAVAETLLAYAEDRRRLLKAAERAILHDAAAPVVLPLRAADPPATLAALALHDPDIALAAFGVDTTRTPETP